MKNAANWWLPSRRMLVILCLLLGGIGVAHAAEVQKGYYDDPGIYPNRAYINNHYAERIIHSTVAFSSSTSICFFLVTANSTSNLFAPICYG